MPGTAAHEFDQSNSIFCAHGFYLRSLDCLCSLCDTRHVPETRVDQWNIIINRFRHTGDADFELSPRHFLLHHARTTVGAIAAYDNNHIASIIDERVYNFLLVKPAAAAAKNSAALLMNLTDLLRV